MNYIEGIMLLTITKRHLINKLTHSSSINICKSNFIVAEKVNLDTIIHHRCTPIVIRDHKRHYTLEVHGDYVTTLFARTFDDISLKSFFFIANMTFGYHEMFLNLKLSN